MLKLVAVVAAASLAGIGLGTGLAKLSGNSASPIPAAATTTASGGDRSSTQPASTTAAQTATEPGGTSTAPASTTTQPGVVQGTANPNADVEVLSARLGTPSNTNGHARLRAEVRVTNRATTPLQITSALLLSGDDQVPLDAEAHEAAGALLKPIAAGASATGTLRFTTATAVTQRLLAKPVTHVRIADKTVEVQVKLPQGTGTGTTTTG
jgi:hypothetical protein